MYPYQREKSTKFSLFENAIKLYILFLLGPNKVQ